MDDIFDHPKTRKNMNKEKEKPTYEYPMKGFVELVDSGNKDQTWTDYIIRTSPGHFHDYMTMLALNGATDLSPHKIRFWGYAIIPDKNVSKPTFDLPTEDEKIDYVYTDRELLKMILRKK